MQTSPAALGDVRLAVADGSITVRLTGVLGPRSERLVAASFESAWNCNRPEIVLDLTGLESCDPCVERALLAALTDSIRRAKPVRLVGALPTPV